MSTKENQTNKDGPAETLCSGGWFDVFVRDYNRCVKRTERKGRLTIACKLGLWSVDGPRDEIARLESEASHYWRQYHEDGEYAALLSSNSVIQPHDKA